MLSGLHLRRWGEPAGDLGGSALSALRVPTARTPAAGVLMPFDSLTLHPLGPHPHAPNALLEAAATRAGLKRLDLALLERHKTTELDRHAPGWAYRYRSALQIVFGLTVVASSLGFIVLEMRGLPIAAAGMGAGARVSMSGAAITICSAMEAEIAQLDDPKDRKEFLDSLGVKEPGLHRLIREAYSLLGLITYFTAGEKEVRAWTIRRGTKAPGAAGVIHTDFERGFIRAETYACDDLFKYKSETAVKEAGRYRSEGKEYVVNDGDIMLFRFNV